MPIVQTSMRYAKGVAYHDFESIVKVDERARIVEDLGQGDIMILRNHGLLTCGRTIAEAFHNMFWLKRACDIQVMALSCNVKLIQPSPEIVEKTWRAYEPGGSRHKQQLKGLLEWPGHVAVKPWLAQASVYVLPSYREGLPRSTQEAMAMGRPVITTDVPGCRETVEQGVNGFMVQVRDAGALAQAMLIFVKQPELIAPMGAASRRMAEAKFDVHKINTEILKIMAI